MDRKCYSGWPDGEPGNRTRYIPVEAGTGADLGKKEHRWQCIAKGKCFKICRNWYVIVIPIFRYEISQAQCQISLLYK